MSGGGAVSIPGSVRRTIQNIKEIAGGHTDDEVYAMLRDCNMDPNETAQRLLLQDTFHEVKRKRDKRKENTKESADTRWRPGVQGRGGRGGRGNYSSRYISSDAGGGRNSGAGKENGDNQGTEKGITTASLPITQDTENKTIISGPSCVADLVNSPIEVNGPIEVERPVSSQGHELQTSGLGGITLVKENSGAETTKLGAIPLVSIVKNGSPLEHSGPTFDHFHSYTAPAAVSGVYASVSDPILLPSIDSSVPGMAGLMKREVGSQQAVDETSINQIAYRDLAGSESLARKVSSEINSSYTHAKVQGKSQGFEGNQLSDASRAVSPSLTGSTGSRSSSNYSSRSQQLSGSQKVGPTKEWKPKSTQVNPGQSSAILGAVGTSEVASITKEAVGQSPFVSSSTAFEDTTLKLQKKLEELHFSDTKHVIIPNHLQVPESERTGLSFGSFDTSFVLGVGFADGPDDDKNSTPLSESSQEIEENDEDLSSSIHVASSMVQETDYPDHPPSPTQMPENLSSRESDVVPSGTCAVPEFDQSKLEAALAPEGPHYSVVHTAPTYSSFGMVPQIFGNQFAPFEATDSQSRDASRLPSFVVPQPFDPSTNFYAQIYRPTSDGDGRYSPFITSAPSTKLNGNVAVLPAQSGQSPQESGSSLVLSAAGPTPLATQAAGLVQNSIAVNQAVPVFRQAAAMHMPFPPNYLPYTQYFSPFFVPPPAMHPFINNAAFPQQPPTGSIYPAPAGAGTANPVKYSVSQFKPGTNTGSPIGIPAGYGTYSSSPTGYSPNPAASSGNSAGNEDATGSQYKENNVYITGHQQSEGSAVWMPAPGRDLSGLQGNSYYNLPPQGQHMSFAPTQAGHGPFAGIYHPNQTVAANVHSLLQQTQAMTGTVEMVGAPAGVYQQPQRAQVNWTNNY